MSIEESRERLKQAEKEIRADQDRQSRLYSLEEIEAAMVAFGGRSKFCGQVKELLTRPRPEFAEGQVIFDEKHQCYGTAGDWTATRIDDDCRPLTLTEHGPAVREIRAYVEMLAAGANRFREPGYIHTAIKALAAFDSEISDD